MLPSKIVERRMEVDQEIRLRQFQLNLVANEAHLDNFKGPSIWVIHPEKDVTDLPTIQSRHY
jgi:hypothetical protein